VTESPSEAPAAPDPRRTSPSASPASSGATAADFGTPKVRVVADRAWVEAHAAAQGAPPLLLLAVGDRLGKRGGGGRSPNGEVEERYEVITCLSDVAAANFVIISTDLPKDDAVLPTLIEVFGGRQLA
jgi:hypothetical protein